MTRGLRAAASTARQGGRALLVGLLLLSGTARSLALLPSGEGWCDLGDDLAGTYGSPLLTGEGHLIPGTPLSITLSNVREQTAAFGVVGLSAIHAPFRGGIFVPQPILIFGISTGGTPGTPSTVELSDVLPADVPLGTELHLQFWIADPVGPAGFAASNAIRGTARTLFDVISEELDSLLEVAAPPGNSKRVYTTQNFSTQTYVRNPSCWAASINLTGLSPWNQAGGPTRAGTLISPRHVAFAKHFSLSATPGSNQLVFVTANNVTVTRSVTAVAFPGNDIGIGVLDADVPPEIAFHKVLPRTWINYLPVVRDLPMLVLDQEEKALVRNMFALSASCTHWAPQDPLRLSFHENLIGGDSGNPAFLVVGGEALLVLTHFTTDLGPSYTWWFDAVNSAMTSLGGGYQLTEYDMDAFLQQ